MATIEAEFKCTACKAQMKKGKAPTGNKEKNDILIFKISNGEAIKKEAA